MAEFSRRNFLGALGVGSLAAGGALTGCSGDSATRESGTDFAMPTFQPSPELEIEPFHTSDTPGMQNVYTDPVNSWFPSVERQPGSGGTVTSFQLTWGDPPKKLEENEYWQELNDRLGVSFEPTFVPQPVFDDKFATMLASGEVPDLVFVNDQSAVNLQAIRDGAFADLSDVLAGDNILQWPNLAAREEHIWRASLKDGRIYQIPSTVWSITNVVAMRADLVEQTATGPTPNDADQLLAMLKEVTALGSGPGGQKVYGVNKYDAPMWRWIFKTGPDWQLNDDGDLVHVTETPQYVEMLTWLAAAWSEGVFDPVAMTANPADISSGTGLEYRAATDTFATSGGFHQDEADLEGVKMDFFDLPGYDGTGPVVTRNIPYGRSTCVSAAAAEDEDRLTEVLNVLDYLSAPYGSEEALFVGSGIEGRHYTLDEHGSPISTNEYVEELGVQYVGVVSGPNDYYGHPNTAPWAERFATVMENMAQHSIVRPLEGLESNSQTFVTKGSQLQQLWDDFERGVVSGRESVDDLASFVSNYMGQGGEQVRAEYSAALEERDK